MLVAFLFSKKDYSKAITILRENGYSEVNKYAYYFPYEKHYRRLQKKNNIAAIEIHKEIIIEKYFIIALKLGTPTSRKFSCPSHSSNSSSNWNSFWKAICSAGRQSYPNFSPILSKFNTESLNDPGPSDLACHALNLSVPPAKKLFTNGNAFGAFFKGTPTPPCNLVTKVLLSLITLYPWVKQNVYH